MSSLRERLAAKAPRRVVQPVQVTPPSAEEVELVADLTEAIVNGQSDPDKTARLEALRAERYVEVPFAAVDSKLWEKVAATHPAPEGADGGMDWRTALPVVAALCCEDESLQDDEAWTEILASWSHGELVGLWGALLSINTDHPSPHLPKG